MLYLPVEDCCSEPELELTEAGAESSEVPVVADAETGEKAMNELGLFEIIGLGVCEEDFEPK